MSRAAKASLNFGDLLAMNNSLMQKRFERFAAEPTPRKYLALRERILDCSDFDPYSVTLHQLQAWLDEGQFELVLQQAAALGPLWCLSPRVHFLLGYSAAQTGDRERAEGEKRLTHACLQCLLDLGDGSPETPFLPTYFSDEYDILRALSAEVRDQQLVETDTGLYDVITCHDSSELWFDVGPLLRTAEGSPRRLSWSRSGALAW